MKKIFTLILVLLFQFSFAQNLITNGSFEDTIACPSGGGQIDYAVGWSSFSHTPDYCNSCNSGFVSIPSNQWGYQYAKTGNAYGGIITYISIASNYREYIGSELIQPLTIGQEYYVSFYVAMAFNMQGQRFGVAANKMGIKMSTVSYSAANPPPIDNNAQIFTDSIITDTLNWTRLYGSFIADSSYSYIILGNFFRDSLTSTVFFDSSAWYAYYYIDDIRFSADSNFVNSVAYYDINSLITIFPNPAKDWIDIKGKDIKSFVLYDVLGRKTGLNDSVSIFANHINISFLSKGIYFLKVRTHDNIIFKKIIIQ